MGFRFVGPIAVAIAVIVGGARESLGFTPQYQALFRSILPSQPSSALHALVYGADGKVVGDDVFDNPDETTNAKESSRNSKNDNNEAALLESLKTSVGNPIVWSKIACAFAPPPHDKLTPEVIRDAVPVGLSDNKSIDIAVAVPASVEGGSANAAANQLVRVLVKVDFLQAWAVDDDSFADNSSEMVPALVEQVKILEAHAEDRLAQRISSSGPSKDDPRYYEKLVIEQRWSERLQEEPSSSETEDLPEWWVSIAPPFSSMELVDEVVLLKGLLNEDEFEDELRALFVRHCNFESKDNILVLRAAVASIGSSGLFLKARVATAENSESENSEEEIVATASIPYGNPPKETKSVGELRDGVLTLVESVVPMPMPVRPQATAVSKEESESETIIPFNEQVMERVNELDEKAATTSDVVVEEDGVKESTETEDDDVNLEEARTIADKKSTMVSEASPGASRTQQPRSPDEEAMLAAKYAAIEDLGERAFVILRDLGMV